MIQPVSQNQNGQYYRVIEETVKEKLPENFQTAEYLKSHGMIDIVIPRSKQKEKISHLLKTLTFYIN